MASSTVFSSFPRLFDNSEKPFQEFELALASHISLPGHAKGDLEAGLRTAFNITEDKDEGRAASCGEQEILTEFLVESRHQSSNQDAEQEMIKAEGRKKAGKGAGSIPDPDPYVFGPPGSASGSISYKYESESGSFPFPLKVLSGLK